MNQAWELLFEGKIDEAKQLVQADFCLANCKDYSLLNLMGYIYLYEKKYEDCLEVYQRYLHLAITEKDRENEHIAYHQLAMVYREMNDFQTALSYIEKEREVIEQDFSEDDLKSSVNDYEQGYLRLKLGKIFEANTYMQQSLDSALKTDDLIAQACAYRGLGEIYQNLDSSKSHDCFSHSIQLFDKAGDEIGAEEVRDLIDHKKQPIQATFLKFFINIWILWFVDFYKGLKLECWEDLVEFLVIVIPNLAFDSDPSVIFVLIGVSCGQESKNS